MKKNFPLFILALSLLASACSKKSSGDSNNNNVDYSNYQKPQYGPPDLNWSNYGSGYTPPGNCGRVSQMPSGCWGTYQGYSYCGTQWYYQSAGWVWVFPSTGSCNGGGYQTDDDDWWDDYEPCGNDDDDDCWSSDDDDDDSHHDDDDDDQQVDLGLNINKWVKMWNNQSSNQSASLLIKPKKNGIYYISFKGDYTGKSQDEEQLKVMFSSGKTHYIKDLEQKHTGSGEKTKSCKVYVSFELEKNETYKIILKGNEDSVNNTHLRVTDYWPKDISTLCD